MTKILAIADIHIHDYPQRNPSEKYRLYQTRTVCKNIIEAGQANGCDVIVIAGDTLEKSIVRPYVQAEVKLFLDTLMKYFKVGYIIWGNHDADAKSNDIEFSDSCLSVMLPPNLYYADKKETTIDGCRIGFYNWRPEFDLSWISGKVDVLFTHATISYSEEDQFHSQKLDERKFDIAICGDIHKPGRTGKYISIGIPQRCKMGDSEYSTGIVLDCSTKKIEYVNLNPHNNLMRFQHTSIREEEGWNPENGIWSVYKPENQSISGGVKDIKVPAWEEIDKLVNGIILDNGLKDIHSEVLKNIKDIDKKEVDFNFVITRFYCKNWRSIEEVELFFGDMDKVLITGSNGSGKSSLLSAIKYAFQENSSLKDFVQFGTKECITEVEFLYQGNGYKIQRGSKKYGFWINGEPQKYNNVTEFRKDMHVRFPFIDYMDIYFFDSDHPKLIGDITPERKSEIISKFYKMDKIDAYNDTATELYNKYVESCRGWKAEIDKTRELLGYIRTKLDNIQLPGVSEKELREKRELGSILQKKWVNYNQFMTMTANLQAQKENTESRISSLMAEQRQQRTVADIDQEIASNRETLDWIATKTSALQEIKLEGRRLYMERQGLDQKKICPGCGRPIENNEHLETHKKELDEKIQELLTKQGQVYQEFWDAGYHEKEDIDSGLRNTTSSLNTKTSELVSEKRDIERITKELETLQGTLATINMHISQTGPIPEKVELPDDFMDQMARIEADLMCWQQYNTLNEDRANAERTLTEYQGQIDQMSQVVAAYQEYIKLTGPTGVIYKEIMSRLAEQFSDNRIKYGIIETEGKGNRKDHLNLESYYMLYGNPVQYKNCSEGQKTLLDVDFLSKIVTRMGLLVMDEFLKHLDAGNHDVVLDLINQMNVGLIMISSHMESIPAFNNKSLTLSLNDSGVTTVTMK